MMLTIDECDARDAILLVVVGILVPPLDQLLLRFLQTKWTNESVAIIGYVDVGHVTWVINARLALQMMSPLVDEVSTCLPVIVYLLERLLVMTFIDRILCSVAVQILLARDRLKRFFSW